MFYTILAGAKQCVWRLEQNINNLAAEQLAPLQAAAAENNKTPIKRSFLQRQKYDLFRHRCLKPVMGGDWALSQIVYSRIGQ